MSCQLKTIPFTENDTEPFILSFPGVDITGYVIAFHIGYATPLVKPATIIVASPDGQAQVAFVAGDLIAGDWEAEIQITKPGPVVITSQKFIASIAEEIA